MFADVVGRYWPNTDIFVSAFMLSDIHKYKTVLFILLRDCNAEKMLTGL